MAINTQGIIKYVTYSQDFPFELTHSNALHYSSTVSPVYFITVKYIDFLPYAANLQLLIQAYISSTLGKVIFVFFPYQYHLRASGRASHQGVTTLVHVDRNYTETCKGTCHVNPLIIKDLLVYCTTQQHHYIFGNL